jgi:hypothetical protein
VVLAAIARAAAHELETRICQLSRTSAHFLDRREHWHDYQATQTAALSAAQNRGDLVEQAAPVAREGRRTAGVREAMIRAPAHRPTLLDPYHEHLRKRRAEDPAVPLTHLLGEITRLSCTGSANLLMRYISQGRVEAGHAAPSPKKPEGLLLADLANPPLHRAGLTEVFQRSEHDP